MSKFISALLASALFIASCSAPMSSTEDRSVLVGKRITIDPGHGDTEAYDRFRIGPTGEREEWINLRVAKTLARMLRRAGADVILTRNSDKDLSLGGRATLAKRHGSHLFVSIHHNGSGNDPEMDLPIVYFYGDARMNPASVDFAQILMAEMRDKLTFNQPLSGAAYSDHLIYSSGTSVLRNTVKVLPGVIGEAGFFTNTEGELRLKSRAYNKLEAEVYFNAIVEYFKRGYPTAVPVLNDTLKHVVPGQVLEFKLDDGFGGSRFDQSTVLVLQGLDTLGFLLNRESGILSAQTQPTEDLDISFQVFGRNQKGNAIHPRVYEFPTEAGVEWYVYDFWGDAFKAADSVFTNLNEHDSTYVQDIDSALHLYQLSLDLQIVHAKARTAEERILDLLKMKESITGDSLEAEITEQRQRLLSYYPE